jgi:hypothetical protein
MLFNWRNFNPGISGRIFDHVRDNNLGGKICTRSKVYRNIKGSFDDRICIFHLQDNNNLPGIDPRNKSSTEANNLKSIQDNIAIPHRLSSSEDILRIFCSLYQKNNLSMGTSLYK